MMERIVNIAKNYSEAEDWDIAQQLAMTPEERQAVARELRIRYYGETCKDVREDRTVRCHRIHSQPMF